MKNLSVPLLFIAWLYVFWWFFDRQHRSEESAQRACETARAPAPSHQGRPVSPPSPRPDEAGALSFSVEAATPLLSEHEVSHVAASTGSPFVDLCAEAEETWQPTAAGLFDLTTEQWSQPGFIELTAAEARALLPDFGEGRPPDTIFALFGGFPTLEDCAAGLRDESVRAQLEAVCEWNLVIADMEAAPLSRRTKQTEALLVQLRRTRAARTTSLMEALDRVGPYRNWALVSRLFNEWERE
jgi:hypothetical protein